MRVLPPRTHMMLDLVYAAVAVALPRRLGWSRRSTRLLSAAAAATLATRMLPMKVHLIIDVCLGLVLLCAQFQLTEEESEVRAAFVGFGLVGAAAVLLHSG